MKVRAKWSKMELKAESAFGQTEKDSILGWSSSSKYCSNDYMVFIKVVEGSLIYNFHFGTRMHFSTKIERKMPAKLALRN